MAISIHQFTLQIISLANEYRAAALTAETPAEAERWMGNALKNERHAAKRIGLDMDQHTADQRDWAWTILANLTDDEMDRDSQAAKGNLEGRTAHEAARA